MSQWLWRARRFGGYEAEELEHLGAQLRSHDLFQLYQLLIGSHRWEEDEVHERRSLREKEQRRQEGLKNYLERLSGESFEQVVQDLSVVVSQAKGAGETSYYGLNELLRGCGQQHPELAQQLIERILAENLPLKPHLGYVVAGLRDSRSDLTDIYIEDWSAGSDPILWHAVAYSYRSLNWSNSQASDYDVLSKLISYEYAVVDHEILSLSTQIAPYNPDFAINSLKALSARGDEGILRGVAEALAWPDSSHEGYTIEFEDPQDFLEIVQNLDRVSDGDFWVQECLQRLGQIAPMQIVDFIERRIIAAKERHKADEHYRVVPVRFVEVASSLRTSSQYLDALQQVRDWMLNDDPLFVSEAPNVLVEIAGGLGAPLYGVLMEWIESNDVEKLRAVAGVLRLVNDGRLFYDLSRELICRTNDQFVIAVIEGAIGSTSGGVLGGMSGFYQQRLEAISAWADDEDLRVRHFARRLRLSLQSAIEREQARERLALRTW